MGEGQRSYLWIVAGAVALSLGVVALVLFASAEPLQTGSATTTVAASGGGGDATQELPELSNAVGTTVFGPEIELSSATPVVSGTLVVDGNEAVRSGAVGGEVRFRVIPESADHSPQVQLVLFPTSGGPGTAVLRRTIEGDPLSFDFAVTWPEEFTYRLELVDPGGIGGMVALSASVRAGFETSAPNDAEVTAAFSEPIANPVGAVSVEIAGPAFEFDPEESARVYSAVVAVPTGYFDPEHSVSLSATGDGFRIEAVPAVASRSPTNVAAQDEELSLSLSTPPVDCDALEGCRTVYWIVFINDGGTGPIEWQVHSNANIEGASLGVSDSPAPGATSAGTGEVGDVMPLQLSVRDGADEDMVALFWPTGTIDEENAGVAVVEIGGGSGTPVRGGDLTSWAVLCQGSCTSRFNMALRRSLAGQTTFDPGAGRPAVDWVVGAYLVTPSGDSVPASTQMALSIE